MGLAAALLASVKQVNPTVQFRFSALTVAAFVVTGASSIAVFQMILRATDNPGGPASRSRRVLLILFAMASGAILLASLGVALKDVSPDGRTDFIIGALTAVAVIAGIGWFSWRIVRFLDSEEEPQRRQPRDSRHDPL